MIKDGIIVNIFGNPCVGKSTLAEKIMNNQDGIYCVDFDVIKRQLSGYYWKRDRDFSKHLTRDFLEIVVRDRKPIVSLLPMASTQEEYDFYFDSVKKSEYKIINILLTMDREALIQRYNARLVSIARQNPSFKVKTLEEFMDFINRITFIPEHTNVIDTGANDAEAVYEEFKKIMQNVS